MLELKIPFLKKKIRIKNLILCTLFNDESLILDWPTFLRAQKLTK